MRKIDDVYIILHIQKEAFPLMMSSRRGTYVFMRGIRCTNSVLSAPQAVASDEPSTCTGEWRTWTPRTASMGICVGQRGIGPRALKPSASLEYLRPTESRGSTVLTDSPCLHQKVRLTLGAGQPQQKIGCSSHQSGPSWHGKAHAMRER